MASSQTLSPVLNGVNFRDEKRDMWILASSWAARASFRMEIKDRRRSERDGREVGSRIGGMAIGLYPRIMLNGVVFVMECVWMLWENSRSGMESAQVFGAVPQ